MAQVFASPTMLGKRSHSLSACDPASSSSPSSPDSSPFQSTGCKRRRPFDPLPSSDVDTMRVAAGFDGLGGGQQLHHGGGYGDSSSSTGGGWGGVGRQQQGGGGGFMFGGGSGGGEERTGGGVLGKRQFSSSSSFSSGGGGGGGRDRDSAAGDGGGARDEVAKLKAEFTAYVTKREGEVKVMTEQHAELNRAFTQAQVQLEQLRNENRILKKGIGVQAGRVEKYEEEIRGSRGREQEAINLIQRLQNANHALTLQLMQAKGSCHDFIHHQGPPDVF